MADTPKPRPESLPLLAVRDVVFFPHMTLPLSVGRDKSVKALEEAMRRDHLVFVVAQKQAGVDEPGVKDLHKWGVLGEVIQFLKMPDGTLKVFLQGVCRAKLESASLDQEKGYWTAKASYRDETVEKTMELEALVRHTIETLESYAKLSRKVPQETVAALTQIDDASKLADSMAANVLTKLADRQAILETPDAKERLEKLIKLLNSESEILQVERKIQNRVRGQIEKTQKEYYLTEQMKAIQKELRQKDDFAKELDELKKKILESKMHKEAEASALRELSRLEKMMPFSPEATVCRTYLDWMVNLPWAKRTKDRLDLDRAKTILDGDHFGLDKAKDRILEYLAVCKLTKRLKGPILCFVGPPGVGKTSLGRSIAKSMGREFARISLGGVRDEAEIRGHRRTYIGSLPGRIIQALRKVKTKNPVFLLDEIDKMGMDWRGDPAAALLEVLDPEQNSTFVDHYLDVEFDLSDVMFITTANTLEGIPISLIDRLETLRFPGYTHNEKITIAKGHLIPKQLKEHGLPQASVQVSDAALDRVIHEYTREAGVRQLEREVAHLCRRSARKIVQEKKKAVAVGAEDVPKYLGIPKFTRDHEAVNDVGVATGLAWTEHGGETLAIEVASSSGKGEIVLTGKLGDVMRESARAALSYVQAVSPDWGIPASAWRGKNFHIHVPEGAVPKDGPSAGVAIATAIASLLTGRPVRREVAMTGELTLRGRVLPIGGLKEKVIAAHREGLKTVLFPKLNLKDLEEIPKEIQKDLELVPIADAADALRLALSPKRSKTAKRTIRRSTASSSSIGELPPPPLPS
jgi:ATP-dependent Lon protease